MSLEQWLMAIVAYLAFSLLMVYKGHAVGRVLVYVVYIPFSPGVFFISYLIGVFSGEKMFEERE